LGLGYLDKAREAFRNALMIAPNHYGVIEQLIIWYQSSPVKFNASCL